MIDRIDLGRDLEAFVHKLAASDRFASVDAVMREGVRMLEAREAKIAALNAAIDIGLEDAKAGRMVPLDEAFDRVEAKLVATIQSR